MNSTTSSCVRTVDTAVGALIEVVATLPTETDSDSDALESKQFDLIVLNLQLAMLRTESTLDRLQRQVRTIAEILGATRASSPSQQSWRSFGTCTPTNWRTDATFPMVVDVRR